MNHTSSNPLQRLNLAEEWLQKVVILECRCTLAPGRLQKRAHRDKGQGFVQGGTFTEFPMSVPPSLFEGTINDTRVGVTVSPLPPHAQLQSIASLPCPETPVLKGPHSLSSAEMSGGWKRGGTAHTAGWQLLPWHTLPLLLSQSWPPGKLQQLAPHSYSCCTETKGEPAVKTTPPPYPECCQLSALCPTKPPDTQRPEPCDCAQLQPSQIHAKSLVH